MLGMDVGAQHHSNILPWIESLVDVITISEDVNEGNDISLLQNKQRLSTIQWLLEQRVWLTCNWCVISQADQT